MPLSKIIKEVISMKKTELCTFGQNVETVVGYDEESAEIVLGKSKTIVENGVDVSVKAVTIYDSFEYQKICTLFEITPFYLLKSFTSGETMIDNIWNRIFDIDQFPCLCISIFIIDDKLKLKNQTTKWGKIKPINKISSGFHIFMLIPMKQAVDTVDTSHIIRIIKQETQDYPNFLNLPAKILINYEENLERTTAIDFLSFLLDFVKTRHSIHCTITTSTTETKKPDISKPLSLLLSIKKVLHVIQKMFPDEAKHVPNENKMPSHERIKLGLNIVNELEELQSLFNEGRPPININNIYFMLHNYHDYFLKELYNSPDTFHNKELEGTLKKACRHILATPFSKISGCWILKMNEKNEDEIQKLIDKKYCIVLNETTIKYLKEVYSDDNDYCFILSEKDDAKHFQEPMLHYLKDKFYKIGISTYQNEPDISTKLAKEAIIFLECDCHSEKKVWMCKICKLFLSRSSNYVDLIICNCGILSLKLIERKCLKSKTPGELQYNKQLFDQESCQDINSDICNDLKSGPKDTIKNVSVPKESSTENLASPESKSIIFVGQTGAGKSTLINSIANYIKYDFDNACQNFMRCCLPLNFQMQTADMKNFTIKAGPENENENFNEGGHSVTQKPQTYTISGNNEIINIIDTPGLGDSRGADQDVINMEYIRTAIIGCEKIDAICFIMPSNTSKLTAHFEVVMRDLLSLFPKTALKNVFFFFTYANSSFFAIGNTAKSLEQFIVKFKETNNAEILFGPENVFCVDSEAFMYFLAIEHQYQYRNRSRESFRDSWEKSKEAINKFFSKLKSVEPIKSTDIKMNYELEKCAVEFSNNLNLSSELKNISNLIAQTFVDNSMSSISFTNRKHFNDAELKESVTAASEFCKKLAKDDILKQKIEQLLQYYYKISFDENDTNFPITPINCKLKTELKEICKSLVKIWKPDETDAIYLNALLCIHCAVYSKEILENLEDSLKILQNHFGTSENREIQQKIEKLLSMFI